MPWSIDVIANSICDQPNRNSFSQLLAKRVRVVERQRSAR